MKKGITEEENSTVKTMTESSIGKKMDVYM